MWSISAIIISHHNGRTDREIREWRCPKTVQWVFHDDNGSNDMYTTPASRTAFSWAAQPYDKQCTEQETSTPRVVIENGTGCYESCWMGSLQTGNPQADRRFSSAPRSSLAPAPATCRSLPPLGCPGND